VVECGEAAFKHHSDGFGFTANMNTPFELAPMVMHNIDSKFDKKAVKMTVYVHTKGLGEY